MPLQSVEPRIELLSEQKLVGVRATMSVAHDETGALWRRFMSGQSDVRPGAGQVLYSLQRYPPAYFTAFNPLTAFEKWAAAAATDFSVVPPEMESFTLAGGRYAVFGTAARNSRRRRPSGTFWSSGCPPRATFWTTDRTLSCWAPSTATTPRIQKKKSGYPSCDARRPLRQIH